MTNWKVFALTLAALLLIPAVVALAEAPAASPAGLVPSSETPSETPPEATEEPAVSTDAELNLDLGLFELPKEQRQIRTCTEQEAASISCQEECCLCIANTPRCFC